MKNFKTKTIKLMIKTLRYAFVAALMMVAGAVNAQTTFDFPNYYKDAIGTANSIYLNKNPATIGDINITWDMTDGHSGPCYYTQGYIRFNSGRLKTDTKYVSEEGNTMKIVSNGKKITKIYLFGPGKYGKMGTLVSSEGNISKGNTDLDAIWEGSAQEVSFRCKKNEEDTQQLRYAKIVVCVEGETYTGINNITVDNAKKGVRYNLAGHRVNESYKGVVIENGKKMIVK